MASNLDDIAVRALALSAEERAQLAYRLTLSLEQEIEAAEDIEALWMKEAARRLEEVRAGKAELIDADEAMRRAHKALEE